jgi:hypothetical protein
MPPKYGERWSSNNPYQGRNLSNAPHIGDLLSSMQYRRIPYIPRSQIKTNFGPRIFKPQLQSAQQQANRIRQ